VSFPRNKVNSGVQPPLIGLRACAVRLEVLIDLDDGTAVLTTEAVDPISEHLVAFSSKRVCVEYLDRELGRFFHSDFFPVVREHSGPFA
jgi:hypothetical protein